MKIYLIRHGETTGDVEDRFGGTYDDHLSSNGKEQVEALAQRLKDKKIEIIYSSPYFRAKETAEAISKVIGAPVVIIEDIKERDNYGQMSGERKEDMAKLYPDIVEKIRDYHFTPEGAESYEDFKIRVARAFKAIAEEDYRTAAIITHGGPIRCLYRELLNPGQEIIPEDCLVVEIDIEGDKILIK